MRAPPLVRTQLGESMKAIVSKDYPDRWLGLLPAVLQNLSSQVSLQLNSQKHRVALQWSFQSIC